MCVCVCVEKRAKRVVVVFGLGRREGGKKQSEETHNHLDN